LRAGFTAPVNLAFSTATGRCASRSDRRNCVASASARAYWAGGATLGPFMAFAYLAANAAHRESVK